MEIFQAHQQWATRPDDERVATAEELYAKSHAYFEQAFEKSAPYADLRVQNQDGELMLNGKANIPARLTHWAMGQLCSRVGAPASYLRTLPATLAAQNLNHGLANRGAEDGHSDANMLFHQNGGLIVRAITSDKYARIWNWEVAQRLIDLKGRGWQEATPDHVWSDDQIGKTAMYVSDHDMFAFLKMPDRTVREAGTDEPLQKGLIVSNSEVGASSLYMLKFLYRYMCGNHIIWHASDVVELKLRHIGDVRDRFSNVAAQIRAYADESVSDLEAKIARAKTILIGNTKDEVLDAVFAKRSIGISRKLIDAGFDACVEEQDGSPRTPWGLAQGITRFSQTIKYADDRTTVDRYAAKILEAF